MTSSIPQFVQVPSNESAKQPEPVGPVPDTPEYDTQQVLMRELAKIPGADKDQVVPLSGGMTVGDFQEITEAEEQLSQVKLDDPAKLAMDALPKMIELMGIVQECNALMTSVRALAESDHREIHALKERVSFLEEQLAGKPKEENDPAIDLPSPSILSPAKSDPGDVEIVDHGP